MIEITLSTHAVQWRTWPKAIPKVLGDLLKRGWVAGVIEKTDELLIWGAKECHIGSGRLSRLDTIENTGECPRIYANVIAKGLWSCVMPEMMEQFKSVCLRRNRLFLCHSFH